MAADHVLCRYRNTRYWRKLGSVAALVLAVAGYAAEPSTAPDAGKRAEALNGSVFIKSQDAVAFVPVEQVRAPVPWREAAVRLDGDLKEWKSSPPTAVLRGAKYVTWTRGGYNDNLTANLWLARDDNYLYIALESLSDKAPAASRVEVAIADANSPLITTWRDVGMRYSANDMHVVFTPFGSDGGVRTIWSRIPQRLSGQVLVNSFGTEDERREFIEQRGDPAANPKIFVRMAARSEGGKQVLTLEAAMPWRLLVPYVPVSYLPLRFNIAVHHPDGMLAWAPGIVGTYSGAHFPILEFQRPAGREAVEGYGQLLAQHFVNQNMDTTFCFYNPAAAPLTGNLEVFSHPQEGEKPLATVPLKLAPGYSQQKVVLHSEKIGQTKLTLSGRATLSNGNTLTMPVRVPGQDDSISVMPMAVMEKALGGLRQNAAALKELYEQIKARGLDTTYPLAYLTLQEMFIPRCEADMRGGDPERALKNCEYLDKLFVQHRTYMERVLKDSSLQLKVPPRFAPDKLTIKDGYYFAGDKPVFLWGPCLFWYMRADQRYAWQLGFNSAGPEVPLHDAKALPLIKPYLQAFYDNGMLVNASIGSSQFDQLRQEHPEVANVDGNNFLPILVQHPLVRDEIKRRIQADITFLRDFPAVRSYWLWNEPAYSNYSEMTRQDFIEKHLKPRYKTIEALNAQWKSSYKSFEEIQLVKGPGTNHAPWYDFQQFQGDQLADFFSFLHQTARSVDASRPTHVKYMAMSLGNLEIERLQEPADICGHDGNCSYRDIIYLDFCRSLYPGKPISNTEIHIYYLNKPMVERVAWLLALHGLADGNWWCWHSNPKFSNSVGSAESMEALAISGLDVQRLFYPYIYALNQKPKAVATLFPDVMSLRSGGFVNALRNDWGPAQYSLGIQPHYATEKRIAAGELSKFKLLLAGASDFVSDGTYRSVIDYVKGGGQVILTRSSFAQNELAAPRDTSELIKTEGGEPFTHRARIYPLGRGRVICIDDSSSPTTAPAAANAPKPLSKRAVYRRVLDRAMANLKLQDPVRVVPADAADGQPDKLDGLDWRSTEVDGAYVVSVIPADYYDGNSGWDVRLVTAKPIKRLVNLVTQAEIKPDEFKLDRGPNLIRVELEK